MTRLSASVPLTPIVVDTRLVSQAFVPVIMFESIDGPCETARCAEDVARILAGQYARALAKRIAAAPPFRCSDFCHDGCAHGVSR